METEDILAVIIIVYFLIIPVVLGWMTLSSMYWLVTKTPFHLIAHL